MATPAGLALGWQRSAFFRSKASRSEWGERSGTSGRDRARSHMDITDRASTIGGATRPMAGTQKFRWRDSRERQEHLGSWEIGPNPISRCCPNLTESSGRFASFGGDRDRTARSFRSGSVGIWEQHEGIFSAGYLRPVTQRPSGWTGNLPSGRHRRCVTSRARNCDERSTGGRAAGGRNSCPLTNRKPNCVQVDEDPCRRAERSQGNNSTFHLTHPLLGPDPE